MRTKSNPFIALLRLPLRPFSSRAFKNAFIAVVTLALIAGSAALVEEGSAIFHGKRVGTRAIDGSTIYAHGHAVLGAFVFVFGLGAAIGSLIGGLSLLAKKNNW